jgi:hypothetical protein
VLVTDKLGSYQVAHRELTSGVGVSWRLLS